MRYIIYFFIISAIQSRDVPGSLQWQCELGFWVSFNNTQVIIIISVLSNDSLFCCVYFPPDGSTVYNLVKSNDLQDLVFMYFVLLFIVSMFCLWMFAFHGYVFVIVLIVFSLLKMFVISVDTFSELFWLWRTVVCELYCFVGFRILLPLEVLLSNLILLILSFDPFFFQDRTGQ